MKKWFVDSFLPMWAKETVLSDNRKLKRQVRILEEENRRLGAYIRGFHTGLRFGRRSLPPTGGQM